MKGNKVIFNNVRELIKDCSLSNEFADFVEMKINFYHDYCNGEKREDLERLHVIALKLDVRATGGKSWQYMSNRLDEPKSVERLIKDLTSVIEKHAVMVFDPTFTKFNTLNMDGRVFLLIPAN